MGQRKSEKGSNKIHDSLSQFGVQTGTLPHLPISKMLTHRSKLHTLCTWCMLVDLSLLVGAVENGVTWSGEPSRQGRSDH